MKKEYDLLSIIGFSISVISIILFPLCIFGLIFSILGLISIKRKNREGETFAILGIILSSLILIIFITIIISVIAFIFIVISLDEKNQTGLIDNSCLDDGNSLQIKINSLGEKERICVSENGKECLEQEYSFGNCSLE